MGVRCGLLQRLSVRLNIRQDILSPNGIRRMASAVRQTNLLVNTKVHEMFYTIEAGQLLTQIMVKAYKGWKGHVCAMAVYLKPSNKLVIVFQPYDFGSTADEFPVCREAIPFVIEWVPQVIHPKYQLVHRLGRMLLLFVLFLQVSRGHLLGFLRNLLAKRFRLQYLGGATQRENTLPKVIRWPYS